MDEMELEQEFTLEDIMKEFGGLTEEPEAAEEAETAEQEQPEEQEQPASMVTGDTIRLEKIPETVGQVRNARPITDEEDEQPVIFVDETQKAEPYSSEWEPEYEQPIAEYVPPRPIVFHPQSRLRELKRKLVAGPEKKYYELTEIGLGKLQAAIFVCALVVLISAAATAMYAFGWVQADRMRLMVFGQFLAMLISALLGSYQLLEGAADLLRKRFSPNTLLLFTFLLCCVDGVMGLSQQRVPCCAAFSLQVVMSLWSSYQKRNTELGQLDTMRKATHLDGICAEEDYLDGSKGFVRTEGQVEDFMDSYKDTSRYEKVLSVYTLVALCVSVAVGILAGVLHGISAGIQVAAVTALAAMPASLFVVQSRPMAVLERRLHAVGAVLCGWKGVEILNGKAVYPLDHQDLFPAGSVKMNGVKFFGNRQPDEIVAYAAALIAMDGGSLEPLFTHLLDSRNGAHYPAEAFHYYENGGIGASVNGEAVLAGTLPFLKEMGVETPEGIRVNQAVCVAIDGELCGLFAVTYEKDRMSAAGISTLSSYRGLKPCLISGDFMLTPEYIRSTFGVNPQKVLYPELAQRQELREKEPPVPAENAALITGEGLAPFAYAVTGARSLKSAVEAGITVHMIGGILGMLMMLVLAIIGATQLLTPVNLFLYELVWLVPGLLITEWTRSI